MNAFQPTPLLLQFAQKAREQGLFFCLSHQKLVLLPLNSLKDFSKLDKRAKSSFMQQLQEMMTPQYKNIIQALQGVGGDLFHMFEKEAAKLELSGCARSVAYCSKGRNVFINHSMMTHEAYNRICCDKKYLHTMVVNNTLSKHKDMLAFLDAHPNLLNSDMAVANFSWDGKRMKETLNGHPQPIDDLFQPS